MADLAREAALSALFSWDREGEFADLAIKSALSSAGIEGRDAAFATRLFYKTVEMRLAIDHQLAPLSGLKLKKLHPAVLEILRLGACQLLYMDGVPQSAAVNTSVELAHSRRMSRAAGMINAILRRLAREGAAPITATGAEALSLRYSHPLWLVECYVEQYGLETAEHILAANNSAPPTSLRVNTLRGSLSELSDRLALEGASLQADDELPICATLSGDTRIDTLTAFSEGRFAVQDRACVASVLALAPRPGMRLIDMCAAPGGKSLCAAALMQNRGEILSFDVYGHKIELMKKNAARLGATIVKPAVRDGSVTYPDLIGTADAVICDVPCSGLGVIAKKPDLRYKDPADLAALERLQQSIADNAAKYLKPGGRMVYSTCTLRREENELAVERLLRQHPELSRTPFQLSDSIRSDSGELTMLPHVHHSDGFYFCILTRSEA